MQQAINIFGEQGTGKTRKAIELAVKFGTYQRLEYRNPPLSLISELKPGEQPKSIIIDGVPNTQTALNFIKQLLVNPEAPKFIFTSIKRLGSKDSRRITFMEMN